MHMKRWPHAAYLAAGFVLGAVCTASAQTAPDTIFRKLEVLAEVLSHVENHYVDSTSAQGLVYGAARGVAETLDEHSAFFDPEEYRSLVNTTEGEYAGIGVELAAASPYPRIMGLFEGSPAHKAGLEIGDEIISVDGIATEDRDFELVYQQLRGPVGTKLVLEVQRQERTKPWRYTLVRSWIRVAPLSHETFEPGMQYVRIASFSRRVAKDFEALMKRHPPTRGLIIDLRGNPGGLFDEAVDISDMFLSEGPLVTAIGRGGRILEQRTASPKVLPVQPPIAILQNGGSASAAEVLAGALRDRGRARLFGTRSYGKGSVQSILDLSDGSGLKLTIARYVTPSGRRIDGEGIAPDVEEVHKEKVVDAAISWLRTAAMGD